VKISLEGKRYMVFLDKINNIGQDGEDDGIIKRHGNVIWRGLWRGNAKEAIAARTKDLSRLYPIEVRSWNSVQWRVSRPCEYIP
jgi:hypothetical protein